MMVELVCLLGFAAAPIGEPALRSEPAPLSARPEGLDAQLLINEVPTRVRAWLLDLDLRDSIEFYRHYLGERRVELESAHGRLLAAPHAGRFTTVELYTLDSRRTRARVSEAQMSATVHGSNPVPLPAEVRVLSRVSEGAGTQLVQTILARADADAPLLEGNLRRSFIRAGFRLIEPRPARPAGSGEVLSFSDGRRRAEVLLTADHGRTWIMAVVSGAVP